MTRAPVLHADVTSLARALLRTAPDLRHELCLCILRQADRAADHVRRTGRAHPLWGNGTLMAAARRYPLAAERGFDDPEYCGAMETVLRCLIERAMSPSDHRARSGPS